VDAHLWRRICPRIVNACAMAKTPFFARPGDSEALAAALLRVARDPQLRQRFAERNAALIAEKDDWARCAPKMEEVYRWASNTGCDKARFFRLPSDFLELERFRMTMPPRRERLLVVTYRFAGDFPGGAERHLWELVSRLRAQEGIDCEVWTTTARGISPVAHWGAMLEEGYPAGDEITGDGLKIRRFPLSPWPREAVALAAKAIQWRWEFEEKSINPRVFLPFGAASDNHANAESGTASANDAESDLPTLLPGPGWHWPEFQADGSVLRWTHPEFSLLRKAGAPAGELEISGMAPRATTLELVRVVKSEGANCAENFENFAPKVLSEKQEKHLGRDVQATGWFSVRFALDAARAGGRMPAISHRARLPPLGRSSFARADDRARGFSSAPAGECRNSRGCGGRQTAESAAAAAVPLFLDYQALLRRRWERLLSFHSSRARARGGLWDNLFDWARGPRSPALWDALRDPSLPSRFDGVLAANLPWAVIPKVARLCPLPMAAMALWHLDDAYYYWNHYAEALRRARVVLANTRWAAESVWPKFGVEARWAGPGVDDRGRASRREWAARSGGVRSDSIPSRRWC
jgi:hypothetical protein